MSRSIEAIIKHTGVIPEKNSSAKYQTMKAIRIHKYGGPEVFQYEAAPRPQPQADEVLIRVHAAGVNRFDWEIRAGHLKDICRVSFPLILGWDLSGVIEEAGSGANRFKKGDEVFSMPDPMRNGAYAEYIVVRESEVALKPKSLHHIRAAAIPLGALTAWHALFGTAQLQHGQRVLIHGGAGGVGHFAVQLAKWKGALRFRYGLHQESGLAARARSGRTDRLHARNASKTSRGMSMLSSTQSAGRRRNDPGEF